jgi:hypothetical protein
MRFLSGGGELPAANGFSPGGLYSGGVHEQDYPFIGYLGHVFWDQELWIWPPMLPLFPDLAKAAANYRTTPERVASAKQIARWLGYAGAKYLLRGNVYII